MRRKKLLAIVLMCALFIGAAAISNAAELDYAWYAAHNPDVVAQIGDSPETLKEHYESFGRKEGRAANAHDLEAQLRRLFSAEEYAEMYPEVRVFVGNDAEEMFRHYIIFGVLEARRPSKMVSQEAAAYLKTTVDTAMKNAGISTEPAYVQFEEIITDNITKDKGGIEVQRALVQVAVVVESAIATVTEAAINQTPTPSISAEVLSPSVEEPAKIAVWAPLSDHSESSAAINSELQKVNADIKAVTSVHDTYKDITVVSFDVPQATTIPKHTNINNDMAYFFGIGVPYNGEEYAYNWGFTSGREGSAELEEAAAIEAVNADFSESKSKTAEDGSNATFYWGLTTEKEETARWGYLAVKDASGSLVAKYILDFTKFNFAKS